jgi:hypothetical protein
MEKTPPDPCNKLWVAFVFLKASIARIQHNLLTVKALCFSLLANWERSCIIYQQATYKLRLALKTQDSKMKLTFSYKFHHILTELRIYNP